jgi:hypothetical protein
MYFRLEADLTPGPFPPREGENCSPHRGGKGRGEGFAPKPKYAQRFGVHERLVGAGITYRTAKGAIRTNLNIPLRGRHDSLSDTSAKYVDFYHE